jgi:hypothetical protein
MFRSLDLVHDEIGVASEVARSEGQPEIANVLSLGVCNWPLSQLKSLTNVIEHLMLDERVPHVTAFVSFAPCSPLRAFREGASTSIESQCCVGHGGLCTVQLPWEDYSSESPRTGRWGGW